MPKLQHQVYEPQKFVEMLSEDQLSKSPGKEVTSLDDVTDAENMQKAIDAMASQWSEDLTQFAKTQDSTTTPQS